MVPKISSPPKSQYYATETVAGKNGFSSSFAEVFATTLSENRDDNGVNHNTFIAETESREGMSKEMDHFMPPVDLYGFPDGDFSANESQNPFPSAASKDTAAVNDEYRTSEWFNSTIPAPPPPPPRTKTMGVDENEEAFMLSFEAKTPKRSPVNDAALFVGNTNTAKEDISFAESVGNVTIDAHGFPLPPPATPAKSVKSLPNGTFPYAPIKSAESLFSGATTPAKSVKSLPNATFPDTPTKLVKCLLSGATTPAKSIEGRLNATFPVSPAKSVKNVFSDTMAMYPSGGRMRPVKSSPSLNGLFSNAREHSPFNDQQVHDDGRSKSFNELVASQEASNVWPPPHTGAKAIVTDDDVDMMLCEIVNLNASHEGKVYSNPVVISDSRSVATKRRSGSPTSVVEGSFVAEQSSIELVDESDDVAWRCGNLRKYKKRLPSSKVGCSDTSVYCNINFKEVEKAVWQFMDSIDEKAETFSYVVGCTNSIPKEVGFTANETFSLLEDESVTNKMAAEDTASILESITVDEQ